MEKFKEHMHEGKESASRLTNGGLLAAQAAGMEIRIIAERFDSLHHPFPGLLANRNAIVGATQHPRDCTLRNAGQSGDIAHSDSSFARLVLGRSHESPYAIVCGKS